MSSKLLEAQEHHRRAEKYLKTSLFRWKPDYQNAADEYCQAGQAFRIGRDLKSSKECFLKASESYKRSNSLFHAGKALDNAMLVSKEKCSIKEVYDLASEAANLYRQHGSIDSAAVVLDRAAKYLEVRDPDTAVKLYLQAVDVTTGDTNQSCGEYLAKVSRLLVHLKRYDEAVDTITREIFFYQEVKYMTPVGRLTVVLVMVQLARGDTVAAWKVYKEWGVCCEASEAQTLEQLLQAFDDEDAESARKALMSPFIRNMDVEYARLVQLIPLPEATKPAAAVATGSGLALAHTPTKPVMHGDRHEAVPFESAPHVLKPKETIKEPGLDEIHEDETELC